MKTRLMLVAAATATLISSSAFAGLEGSTLDMELTQTGFVGGLAGPSGGDLAGVAHRGRPEQPPRWV